jgi:hypothetical protein
MIAPLSVIADTPKQQIPLLRCASAGMTHHVRSNSDLKTAVIFRFAGVRISSSMRRR